MKNNILFVLIALSQTSQGQHAAIHAVAAKIEPKVIEWRHDIHQNPELGNREV